MAQEQWYYDLEQRRAVRGKVTGWQNRMGPYATRAEAESALDRAEARNEEWDAQDEDD